MAVGNVIWNSISSSTHYALPERLFISGNRCLDRSPTSFHVHVRPDQRAVLIRGEEEEEEEISCKHQSPSRSAHPFCGALTLSRRGLNPINLALVTDTAGRQSEWPSSLCLGEI